MLCKLTRTVLTVVLYNSKIMSVVSRMVTKLNLTLLLKTSEITAIKKLGGSHDYPQTPVSIQLT